MQIEAREVRVSPAEAPRDFTLFQRACPGPVSSARAPWRSSSPGTSSRRSPPGGSPTALATIRSRARRLRPLASCSPRASVSSLPSAERPEPQNDPGPESWPSVGDRHVRDLRWRTGVPHGRWPRHPRGVALVPGLISRLRAAKTRPRLAREPAALGLTPCAVSVLGVCGEKRNFAEYDGGTNTEKPEQKRRVTAKTTTSLVFHATRRQILSKRPRSALRARAKMALKWFLNAGRFPCGSVTSR